VKTPKPRTLVPALAIVLASLLLPASASALDFEIVNESGRPDSEVWVTVVGTPVNVTGMSNNVSKSLQQLEEEGHNPLDVQEMVAGRVYISYGAGVDQNALPFASTTTRFDWVELNVTSSSADQINLTAVEQVGIGMRIETFGPSSQLLGELGSANSDTIFAALQQIPGGPQATIRNAKGEILRVLSPLKLPAVVPGLSYPPLTPYMQSMAGKTITLRTARSGVASHYTGTFAPDGSIALSGSTEPGGEAPATIAISAADLASDIYTGANTPNSLEGSIRRDLLVGFVTGLWGGRYGNDAGSFCTNAQSNVLGPFCPTWWTQPVFGDARTGLEPFPTCDQYAAVLSQYSDTFAHPYTERYAKPEIPIVEDGGVAVDSAKLTILADSGGAQPVAGGNANCGAAAPPPSSGPTKTAAKVKVSFLAKAKLRGRTAKVARLTCSVPCGQVTVVAKQGQKVIARSKSRMAKVSGPVKMRLTGKGRKAMKARDELRVKVTVWVTPTGQGTSRSTHSVKLAK
jgi:hypothetical protein